MKKSKCFCKVFAEFTRRMEKQPLSGWKISGSQRHELSGSTELVDEKGDKDGEFWREVEEKVSSLA